jgi:hypothetical protein
LGRRRGYFADQNFSLCNKIGENGGCSVSAEVGEDLGLSLNEKPLFVVNASWEIFYPMKI